MLRSWWNLHSTDLARRLCNTQTQLTAVHSEYSFSSQAKDKQIRMLGNMSVFDMLLHIPHSPTECSLHNRRMSILCSIRLHVYAHCSTPLKPVHTGDKSCRKRQQKSLFPATGNIILLPETETFCHRFGQLLLPFSATIASASICRRCRQLLSPVWTGFNVTEQLTLRKSVRILITIRPIS